jgi:bacterioferritin
LNELAGHEYKESIDEMKHADRLADRILFLEGLPNFQALGKLRIGENPRELLECDLALEMDALPVLREGIAHAEATGDYVSRELMADILESEEEHVDWLETQLDLIGRIGEQLPADQARRLSSGRGIRAARLRVSGQVAEQRDARARMLGDEQGDGHGGALELVHAGRHFDPFGGRGQRQGTDVGAGRFSVWAASCICARSGSVAACSSMRSKDGASSRNRRTIRAFRLRRIRQARRGCSRPARARGHHCRAVSMAAARRRGAACLPQWIVRDGLRVVDGRCRKLHGAGVERRAACAGMPDAMSVMAGSQCFEACIQLFAADRLGEVIVHRPSRQRCLSPVMALAVIAMIGSRAAPRAVSCSRQLRVAS